ncbi:cytochrome c3 family protein [Arenibaculum sp.]|jgi:hypothetical protein|uniref:cytochrome c3 family protein n=1 Tax=Arenibaculum sp. TaxID=2865862 RepID=UPI002E10C6E5|nr:cytochrome c3 family protein [Arenibaculum sp.]
MAQIFPPRSTTIARSILAGIVAAVLVAAVGGYVVTRSDWYWRVGKAEPQPVPFSHLLHAGDLGLDCRYCHTTVERSALAGIPPAQTCLGCHDGLPVGGAALGPLRTAFDTGEPFLWNRVHRVPDHALFHHGIHVSSGVGCATCHGPVEEMPRIAKAGTLSMSWCLDCHREVEPVGPPVTDGDGGLLHPLTDCSRCHR